MESLLLLKECILWHKGMYLEQLQGAESIAVEYF